MPHDDPWAPCQTPCATIAAMRPTAGLKRGLLMLAMASSGPLMGLGICAAAAVASPSDVESPPPYAPLNAAPNVWMWNSSSLSPPPARAVRLGAAGSDFNSIVVVAGTLQSADGKTALLARFGAVSQLLTVRYWSTTDRTWRALVLAATAMTNEIAGVPRGDFTSGELERGQAVFLSQTDSRSSNAVIYSMRVLESTPRSFIVQTENVTPVRWSVMTLYHPGDLRSLYFLEQVTPGTWSYYSLTRIAGSRWLMAGHENSYINRVVALYRYFAGIQTDLEPPPAP